VTAGPTREPIDPVRFVSNRSTGKMGFALARAARRRGAEVVLVAGPTSLSTPPGVTRVNVTTAREMLNEVMSRADGQSLILKAAAVADHRPTIAAAEKLKKAQLGPDPALQLTANPDILAQLGQRRYPGRRPVLVGFAAETEELTAYAEAKLRDKGCDLIVANDVSAADAGFDTDANRVTIFAPGAPPEVVALAPKEVVADRVLDRAREILEARG
jgi:phosphopantothenoylcysteine decarboxylase/phosphopantothenate--cysteine ligase